MTFWHKLLEGLVVLPVIFFMGYSIVKETYVDFCEYCELLKELNEE